MKADSKELARDSSANADQALEDPFAVDVFAPENASFGTSSGLFRTPHNGELDTLPLNQSWSLRLPRVNPEQLEASAVLAGLPLETYTQIQDSVVRVLSRYSMNLPDEISLSLVELQEMDFASEVRELNGPQGAFATFVIDPGGTSVSIELGARFAAMLVDRVLGGEGAPPDNLRPLTRTERAVVEFLCLSSASELNALTGEPIVRLQSVTDHPPWWTSRINNSAAPSQLAGENWKRGLVASLRFGIGEITGIARAYLSAGALSALDDARRRLQAAGQISSNVYFTTEELARYARISSDLSLTVLIGRSEVTVQELMGLEPGDVMVIESPSVRWRAQRISGSLLVRVGDSDEAVMNGEVTQTGEEEPVENSSAESEHGGTFETGSLKVRMGAFSIAPPPRFAERLKMEQELENAEALAEGASLIDAVMLTVRVELAARRLRLDELSRLRANQILDLGCKATDPVDLIVDGRRIARGELVDIEGRLGVRVTHVSG